MKGAIYGQRRYANLDLLIFGTVDFVRDEEHNVWNDLMIVFVHYD